MTSRRYRANTRRKANEGKPSESGSAVFREPDFVLVGVVRRPHGLRGEVQVSIETDFPERLKKGVKLFLGEEHTPVTIRTARPIDNGLLLSFEQFPDRASLEHIRNAPLFSSVQDSPPLPPGQFYRYQLLGLTVVTDTDEELGLLTQVLETGANDVYVVQSPTHGEVLLPAIEDVVLETDIAAKRMRVHLLPGLLPEI
ncbi:MAG TPA: ribosome maturation factor RimM [Anaerolineales bacterium]|nr:ribosome maturation factor RimM [Anaerolineales bacterium]HRQ91943.1 ribosome maturation factor RimM [Anaerolineales bacterium]